MSGSWVAYEEGFFKKNGLDVELIHIPSTSRAIQAMLAGEMAYSYTDGRTAVQAAMKGADVVMLAGAANRFVFSFMARPEIKKISDLRGRKLVLRALVHPRTP
jgi:ABC-type nitrate/sulfonate/bicarbonate transport system substrate-binding protein